MRQVERGYRGVVRALRKQQEDKERIDALTAMVERLMHRVMVLDCAGDDDVVMLSGVSTRDLVKEARALIGEDGKHA